MMRSSSVWLKRTACEKAVFCYGEATPTKGDNMAVLVEQVFPEVTTVQLLDDVTAEMGVHENPPAGAIVHVHFMRDGRTHIVDVWESSEAYDTFVRDQLRPAFVKVAERQGINLEGQHPETTVTEVATVVRGK
jgi:hypothetical protein